MIHIEQIRPEATWRLRKEILYPGEHLHHMAMEEDNHGYHFSAFTEKEQVAVVSLFQRGTDWQFRKFAVSVSAQKTGVGTQLLEYVTAFAVNEGGTRLWCNARLSATGFYEKFGFTQTGEVVHKNSFDYIIMEKAIS